MLAGHCRSCLIRRVVAPISPAPAFAAVDSKGAHPVNHLTVYKGVVHADGFAGFNGVFGDDKAEVQACLAHGGRKFVDEFTADG